MSLPPFYAICVIVAGLGLHQLARSLLPAQLRTATNSTASSSSSAPMEALYSADEYLHLLHPFLQAGSTDMDRFAAFALSNFSTFIIVSSLGWMLLRAYQVLSKPSQDLIDLLGIEVPSSPALSLHGIKADGVILNWKAPELQRSTTIKYCLYVNGINTGELSPFESSIAITDLKPNTNYIIRVVATNPLNFAAHSEPIHVQTRCVSSDDYFRKHDGVDHETETRGHDYVPTVLAYKLLNDTTIPTPTSTPMLRERSGSFSQKKGGRRVSSSNHKRHESDENEDVIRDLTAQLDKLNQEIEAAKDDTSKEEDEYQYQQTLLNASKNDLKQAVTDKESASRALKKQVADLSSQNSAAQGKRQVAEKRLQSKHDERQKLKDEIKRWDKEILSLRAEAQRLDEQKVATRQEADEDIERLRRELEDEAAKNREMEDYLRQARSEIRELEHEKDRLGQEQADELRAPGSFRNHGASDWPQRLHTLQQGYQTAFSKLEQARNFCGQARTHLMEWERRRAEEPQMFLTPPEIHLALSRNGIRRSRAASLRNSENFTAPYDVSAPPPPYTSAAMSISPAFASVSPFFNMQNGLPMHHDHMHGMSPQEVEQLTAGAPTSPSVAGALLPAGLLGDDEVSNHGELNSMNQYLVPPEPSPSPLRVEPVDSNSSKSSPMPANALPGLGAPRTLEYISRDPASPISNPSRSPSVLASPRESSTHLPFPFNGESLLDIDKHSTRSNASSFRIPPNGTHPGNNGTRFASLFGFNRQRGKTFSDEGPALGSLKGSESQSYPKQDPADEPSTAGKRRGSHSGGTWREQLTSPFTRSANKEPSAESGGPKRRFGMFGPKVGDAPDSPRPGSTGSSESTQLPRPFDGASRFGWTTEPYGQRQGPLGSDWSMVAPNSWSKHPSRRPSQQGSSMHYGPSSIMDDTFVDSGDEPAPPRHRSPKLAPIGTRPASQISASSSDKQKLNPAAPSFKIPLFSREKKSERGEKADKIKIRKDSPKDKERSQGGGRDSPLPPEPYSPKPGSSFLGSELSPSADGRFFSNAPSISTADTLSEPRTSLERTPSRASEATPKESLMQRLSRKSSASMFSWTSKDKNRLSVKKSAAAQALSASTSGENLGMTDETDEETAAAAAALSRSYQSERSLASPAGSVAGASAAPGSAAQGKENATLKEAAAGAGAAAPGRGFSFRRSLTGRRKEGEGRAAPHGDGVHPPGQRQE